MAPSSPTPDAPRQPQFGLRALLLMMAAFSILAAVLGGLLAGGVQRQVFVLVSIAAPVALMIVLGLIDFARQQWNQHRHDR